MLEHQNQNQQQPLQGESPSPQQQQQQQQQQPLLSLRMKMTPSSCYDSSSSLSSPNNTTRPQEEEEEEHEEEFASPPQDDQDEDRQDRLLVMMQQESTTYKCGDYMSPRRPRSSEEKNEEDPPCLVPESSSSKQVDPLCREKMCEWSYRVVDHFHASRETVALSMTLLDKFLEECDCDKSTFKLAAMTTLHVATKLLSCSSRTTHPHDLMMMMHPPSTLGSPVISMSNLAELSRGEFQVSHMVDMEGIIMETLKWHVNPPTCQSFCHEYMTGYVKPLVDTRVLEAIYPRAVFFCELALFDYGFVTLQPSLVALACVLNAMEGLDPHYCGPTHEQDLCQKLRSSINLEWSGTHLDFLRNRLWYLYSQSTQYYEDGLLPQPHQEPQSLSSRKTKDHNNSSSSPRESCASPSSQDVVVVVPHDSSTSSLEDSTSSLDPTQSQEDDEEDAKESSSKDPSHPPTKTHSPVSVVVS